MNTGSVDSAGAATSRDCGSDRRGDPPVVAQSGQAQGPAPTAPISNWRTRVRELMQQAKRNDDAISPDSWSGGALPKVQLGDTDLIGDIQAQQQSTNIRRGDPPVVARLGQAQGPAPTNYQSPAKTSVAQPPSAVMSRSSTRRSEVAGAAHYAASAHKFGDIQSRQLPSNKSASGKPKDSRLADNCANGCPQIYTSSRRSEVAGAAHYAASGLSNAVVRQSAASFTVYAIHTDHLKTPVMMTNTQGDVVWRHRFAPFGKTIELNEDVDGDGHKVTLNLRFPGQYYDAESGLHYNWHRYYDPEAGRYLTYEKLLLDLQIAMKLNNFSVNPYSYSGQNPIARIDPDGSFWVEAATASIIGVVGGALYTYMRCVDVCRTLCDNDTYVECNDQDGCEAREYCVEKLKRNCQLTCPERCFPFITLGNIGTPRNIGDQIGNLLIEGWNAVVNWYYGN